MAHGPILEINARGYMRSPTAEFPQTYSFDGVPAYYSMSALFPDEREENPHAYTRFVYDEDEDCADYWEEREVMDPLAWPTEKEMMERIERSRST
jgi:hypothetical protein